MQFAINQGKALRWAALLGVAVFLLGALGIVLQREAEYIASLWPANAVALALLLGRQKKDWGIGILAVLAGNLALNFAIGNPFSVMAGYSLINTVEPVLGALLIGRTIGHPAQLTNLRRLGCFILCGAMLVPATTAFGGAGLGSMFYGADYWTAWRNWWIADSISVLIFAPPIIASHYGLAALLKKRRRCAELVGLILVTIAVTIVTSASNVFPLVYLTFPFLVLSGMRFRVLGSGFNAIGMSIVAIWMAVRSVDGEHGIAHAILEVQVFLGVSVAASLAIATVLHENREALRRLALSESRFRELVENASEAILVHDLEGRFLDVNNLACKSLGYSREELLQMSVRDIEIGGDKDGRGPVWPRMNEGAIVTVDGVQRRKDGMTFPVEVRLGLMPDHDGERSVIAMVRDVTERQRDADQLLRAKEEAEEASRAKTVFLANTSHELRTPLNAIIGYSELLEEEVTANGHNEYVTDLARIRDAGRHLLDIITGILDLSKVEAGKMEVDIVPVELLPVLEQSVAAVKPLVRQNGNSLKLEVDREIGTIAVDPVKLRQILLNLLSNAAKFTRQGEVVLRASRENRHGAGWLLLEVEDTGIGIAADKFDTLFDAFTQVDSSTTRSFGGTGLGLAISRRYCELMGGQIEVRSEPGKGAMFTVSLPVEDKNSAGASAERLEGDDRESFFHAR